MPRDLVIKQSSSDDGIYDLIFQPSLYVNERSDLSTVVSDVEMKWLDPRSPGAADSEGSIFVWQDNVKWEANDDGTRVVMKYASDAGPLVVLQNAPQSPAFRFRATLGEWLHAGEQDFVVIIHRLGQATMTVKFCVKVSDRQFAKLTAPHLPGEKNSAYFRNTGSFTTTEQEATAPGCYGS
jgi:hypothetical protein